MGSKMAASWAGWSVGRLASSKAAWLAVRKALHLAWKKVGNSAAYSAEQMDNLTGVSRAEHWAHWKVDQKVDRTVLRSADRKGVQSAAT